MLLRGGEACQRKSWYKNGNNKKKKKKREQN
jgi:hypothetical protein